MYTFKGALHRPGFKHQTSLEFSQLVLRDVSVAQHRQLLLDLLLGEVQQVHQVHQVLSWITTQSIGLGAGDQTHKRTQTHTTLRPLVLW